MLAVAGRKTGLIMTNTRKRHTPEQVVRKLGQADRMLADGADVAAVCRELGVLTALSENPQFCSLKFPTLGRSAA